MTPGLDPQTVREVIDRASDPEGWERWQQLVKQARHCVRPIRLRGSIKSPRGALVYTTAREPEGVLLKACGTRSESACPPCSRVYRGDTWQLVSAGLRGGKGVPETIREHPALFVTLTAPSFGAVHRAVDQGEGSAACLPRRDSESCEHGRKMACWHKHSADDDLVGHPICERCFDYENAIVWNALAPELWRRTVIYARRELASALGMTHAEAHRQVRLSFFKVAEYQRRGLLHFHAVVRLDGRREPDNTATVPPPASVTADHLSSAIRAAVERCKLNSPARGLREVRWGAQIDLSEIGSGRPAEQATAYIAKYATKDAGSIGGLARPATLEQAQRLGLDSHLLRFIEHADRLAALHELEDLRLDRMAHKLGFRGHWATKSRRYSTTLGALRAARERHVRSAGSDDDESGDWHYAGRGYTTNGDKLLSATAARQRADAERIARVETRGRHA